MLQQIWNGVTLGSIYALIAIGYTLVFGVLRVVFFAQGELSMIAAFVTMGAFAALSAHAASPIVLAAAVGASLVLCVAVGLLSERLALRPLHDAPRVKPLITSLGVSIVLQNVVMLAVGPQSFAVPSPFNSVRFSFLGVRASLLELAILLILAAVVGILLRFLNHHPLGLAVRAIPQSRDGARLMGMSPNRAVVAVFVMSSTTAAVAGVALALYYGVVKFDMGFAPGIKGFTIAILGGIGNVPGAVFAALLVGVLEALFAGYVSSDYRDVLVFAILIATLILRPSGLLGEGK